MALILASQLVLFALLQTQGTLALQFSRHFSGFPGMDPGISMASLQPKTFYVRNNLDGNIEFRESPNVSLDVFMSGNDDDKARFKVVYKMLRNETIVDIQVYMEPEPLNWPLIGGLAGAGIVLVALVIVAVCCWKKRKMSNREEGSQEGSESDSIARPNSRLIQEKLQMFESQALSTVSLDRTSKTSEGINELKTKAKDKQGNKGGTLKDEKPDKKAKSKEASQGKGKDDDEAKKAKTKVEKKGGKTKDEKRDKKTKENKANNANREQDESTDGIENTAFQQDSKEKTKKGKKNKKGKAKEHAKDKARKGEKPVEHEETASDVAVKPKVSMATKEAPVGTGGQGIKDRMKMFEEQSQATDQAPKRSPGRQRPNTATTTGLLLLSLFAVAMAASMLTKPRARIVILVPSRLVKEGSKMFFSDQHHGRLIVSRDWRGRRDAFKQFAVSQATSAVSSLAPCSSSCKHACDVNTKQCICIRGYKMEGTTCKDIDECRSGKHNCYKNATCTNIVGSYICTCPEGLWGNGVTCKPCTTNKPCPENFYESAKCTRTRDRTCVACGPKCDKSTYQLHGCGLTFDRKCVDISKPLTKAKKGNTSTIIATRVGAKVLVPKSAQKNVLMENRLRVKSTNVTFTIQDGVTPKFLLHRNTGFLVDVEVLETHITPRYKDYNGANGDENAKIASIDGSSEIKTRFCRYPAPNYYELSYRSHSNRQTMVKSALCMQSSPNLCPKYTSTGETYLYRTVNTRCHLAQRDAICASGVNCLLQETEDKLYCTHFVPILDDLFGRSEAQFVDTSLYVFSNSECRGAFRSCETCRKGNCSRCIRGSTNKATSCSCCLTGCIGPCDQYYAAKCESKREPKKCARGETSELKLVPQYSNNLKLSFNCYLQHDEPKRLYSLRYRVRHVKGWVQPDWKTTSLDTSKLTGNVNQAQTKGTNVLDFLEITHNSNIGIPKEMFLKADPGNAQERFRYRTAEMGQEAATFKRDATAKRIQPVKAFSVHVNGKWWMNRATCNKLETWSKIIRSDFTDLKTLEVKHLGNGKLGEIGYEVFNKTNPPSMTVKISQQKSVLKYIFNNSTFVNDKSFRRSIRRTNVSWVIILSGKLTHCPSVIGIKVIDEIDRVKVIESDLLVLCPDFKFNVRLEIPRKGLEDKERLFSVYLTDAQQEYKLQAAILDRSARRKVSGLSDKGSDKRRDPWLVLMPLLVTTGMVILALITLMIYAQKTAPEAAKMEKAWGGYVWVKNKKGTSDGKEKDPDRLKRRHLILVVFIVVVRIVYSIIFSFSMAFAILTLLHADNMKILGDYRSFVQSKVDQSKAIALRMDQFRESEIKSSVDQTSDVQRSCDFHLGVQLKWLQFNMSCALQGNHMKMFNKLTTKVIDKVTAEVKSLEKKVKAKVQTFSDATKQSVRNLKEDVERYGRRVFNNGWFVLPKAAFNIKRSVGKRRKREIGADFMEITDMSHMEHESQMEDIEHGLRVLSRMKRSFSNNKFIDFLDYVGAVDQKRVAALENSINDKLAAIKAGFVDFKQAMASGKPPAHPLSTALLCPVRFMASEAKKGLKSTITTICDKTSGGVQANAHCASINISNFCSVEDVEDIFGGNSSESLASSQRVFFEEQSGVDSTQNISAANKSSVITAARGNKHYNIEKGDAMEEQIESQKEERLKLEGKLRNTTSFVDADVLTTTRTAIVAVLAIVDTLLFVFRCMKTYNIAMKLMYGFEEIVQHDEYEFEEPTKKQRIRNILNRIFDIIAKVFVKFIASIKNLQKKIVRTNFLPMIIIIAIAAVGFYLTIVIVFNVMNVTVIEELGGFRLVSARLDADLDFTNNALADHMKFVNDHDMKMYKQSMQNSLDGYQAVLEDFNNAQKQRFEDFSKRLCSLEDDNSTCIPVQPDFPDVSFSSCIIPRFDSQTFEEYNGTEYRHKLKYESKKYIDAVRDIFLDTLYFIIAVIILFIFIGVFSVIIFYFLKSRGMVRTRYIHVYPTLPPELLKEHGLTPAGHELEDKEDECKEKGSADGINKIKITEQWQ